MSNAIDLLEPDVRVGAVAYLSETEGRDLSEEDLAACTPEHFDDAVRMARRIVRAVEAARAAAPPVPRRPGPVSVADAQALRLDLGAEAVVVVAWMPGDGAVDIAAAMAGNRSLSRRCDPAHAAALTTAIATVLPVPTPAPTPETEA